MDISYEQFCLQAISVKAEIKAACDRVKRSPDSVELLAVTKNHPALAAEYAARFGLKAVGENRVQEGVAKRAECTAQIAWELIGHLQSNKAKLAAAHFDRIQSVDSIKLMDLLDRAANEQSRGLRILLQVNAGRDEAKFGADIVDSDSLIEHAMTLPSLRVEGLMTIAPLSGDRDVARRCFATLRELRDRLALRSGNPLATLSMGMSGDLTEAIEEGSTQVRIGTALFGSRV
jgi:PLP dependent protein